MTKRDIALALTWAFGLAALGATTARVAPDWAVGVVAGGLSLVLWLVAARFTRAISMRIRDLEGAVSQIEPTIALSQAIALRRPLPPLKEYAIAPDFALMLYELVLDLAPRTIVETGSGVSTLICAYALEKLGGDGHVLALDHDGGFAEKTRQALARHGLSHRATVVHGPLEETDVGAGRFLWYPRGALAGVEGIDLVVDDGPPKYVGPMARYASLHVLAPKMREGATFVLDCVGNEEKEIVRRWCAELPFSAEWLETRKGNVIFRRKGRIVGEPSPSNLLRR